MVLALFKGPEHPTKLALFFKIDKLIKNATLIFFWERRYQDTVDFVGLICMYFAFISASKCSYEVPKL